MAERKKTRGRKRVYDAEKTRASILGAAEKCFAEHGYSGVSVDVIANEARCNKSLIFQYFSNKKGLYVAVLTQADEAMAALLERSLAPILQDDSRVLERAPFRAFLYSLFGAFYDHMMKHPQFARILAWEQASGWSTFADIVSRFAPTDLPKFAHAFAKAREAGLLRPHVDSVVLLVWVLQTCWSTVVSLPLYRLLWQTKDEAASQEALREQLLTSLVNGVMGSEDK